jgi:hypothetical protein
MALTPQQLFERSCKWLLLIFVLLFVFKTVQSCNRNMSKTITDKEYIHTIDSLKKDYSNLEKECNDTTKKLSFELKLEREKALEANKRADAVQSVAEKMRANTTVNVRGALPDTAKRK